MFASQDYAKPVAVTSGTDIAEFCRNQEVIRFAVPQDCKLLPPRVGVEKIRDVFGRESDREYDWIAECWWKEPEGNILAYYAKLSLRTGMVKEFRQLSGENKAPRTLELREQDRYLDHCAAAIRGGSCSKEEGDLLDREWEAMVSAVLSGMERKCAGADLQEDFLVPLDVLTYWNWQKLKALLLKRYDTTVGEIRDYLEYKDSGSDKRYIAPKYRDLAREKGIRFWRDDNDS